MQQVSATPITFGILDKDFKHFQKTDRKDFLLSKYRYLRNQNSINEASTGISLGSVDEALKYDLIEKNKYQRKERTDWFLKKIIYEATVLYLWFICMSTLTYAQQVTLSGKVEDAYTGNGLQGVMVTIRPAAGNRILKFTKTQADGSFLLSLNAIPDGRNVLHFSMMGYAVKTIPLSKDTTVYHVLLTEQATKLKDVVVKAPSIRQRGDTISYNVASFADANDKSLADVLKKMPGMEVSDKGEIKYNGKAINKFYIEGHDMLGGRYSIATNNIHQKDVGSVEVMTNHQPIKALEDMSFRKTLPSTSN